MYTSDSWALEGDSLVSEHASLFCIEEEQRERFENGTRFTVRFRAVPHYVTRQEVNESWQIFKAWNIIKANKFN